MPWRRSTSIRRAAAPPAPAPARSGQERARHLGGRLRVALEGVAEPGVVLEPARDLLPERVGPAALRARRRTGQHRRQPVIAGRPGFDQQAPLLQALEVIGCGPDRHALEQPDIDARCQRCHRQDPPG